MKPSAALDSMAAAFALVGRVPRACGVQASHPQAHRDYSSSKRYDWAQRGCLAGSAFLAACSQPTFSRTARRAVDMPVKEPPVTTTVAIPGAKVEEETRQKRADEYRLVLYNDPLNKREYVARCLMTICLLKEGDAYQVMMKAHKEGVAVVGTYAFETAEAYCEGLKAQGLSVDIIPVDKDD
ncbi:unnamed protein product [Cladocopium goreaui]|uniref:Adaptor protein ClpS core domain-containing protein n=1 Tax=Cladocopium goreaui TaxID=2562237 RepID=A0A9P1G7A3_9DINO|nr:unnamed protein product [Cladocopium goreaui]